MLAGQGPTVVGGRRRSDWRGAEAQQREAEIEPLIAMGEEVLAGGDSERAANIFGQILEMAPDHAEVIGGLARALLAAGQVDEARAVLDGAPAATVSLAVTPDAVLE